MCFGYSMKNVCVRRKFMDVRLLEGCKLLKICVKFGNEQRKSGNN